MYYTPDHCDALVFALLQEATYSDYLSCCDQFGILLRSCSSFGCKVVGEENLLLEALLPLSEIQPVTRRVVGLELFYITYKPDQAVPTGSASSYVTESKNLVPTSFRIASAG